MNKAIRILACCLCALLMLMNCTACKPTDFFTQIIYTPWSDDVDEDAPTDFIVNSPTAAQETSELSRLDKSKHTPASDYENSIVTYSSKKQNTTVAAQHSVYDADEQVPGIEASDPVELVYSDSEDALDNEVTGANKEDAKSKSADKGSDKSSNKSSEKADSASKKSGKSSKKNSSKTDGSGKEDDGSGVGDGDKQGASSGDGGDNGEGPSESEGPTRVKGGGYGEDVEPVYNPGDKFQKVQKADHIAAMGQAAVIVEAIGGGGALCAMDRYTYEGRDEQGTARTAHAFKDVFAGELSKDFEKQAVLWEHGGTSKDDIAENFDALVKRTGANGVIFFLGAYGTQSNFFTEDQLDDLQYASIQLVPVDLSTVQGIKDAVKCAGDCLDGSKDLAEGWDSVKMAKRYNKALDNIVKGVGQCRTENRGTYVRSDYNNVLFTSYNSCPLSSSSYARVFSCIGYDFQTGIEYSSDTYKVANCDQGLLFTHVGWKANPSAFWLQCAGVADWPRSADRMLQVAGDYEDSYLPVWQFRWVNTNRVCFSASQAGPLNRYTRSLSSEMGESDNDALFNYRVNLAGNKSANGERLDGGLGSKVFPYLIVDAASDGTTALKVKEQVEEEMRTPGSPYYVTPDFTDSVYTVSGESSSEVEPRASNFGSWLASIGWQWEYDGNVFYDKGQSISDAVRANPSGLLGSWTQGTMESVLEAVWAAQIYSVTPKNSDYVPVTNMDDFSADVDGDGVDEQSFKDCVIAFYQTFYHMSKAEAQTAFADVVVDTYGV